MLLFAKATGTQLTHVPYKGAGEVRAAATGQQITIGAINGRGAGPEGRHSHPPAGPDVGRAQLAGAPGAYVQGAGHRYRAGLLRGLAAPAGLPEGVRKSWSMPWPPSRPTRSSGSRPRPCTALLRYLAPPAYTAELERTEAGFRKLWTEMPWQDGKP
jgi:hypothetical protein